MVESHWVNIGAMVNVRIMGWNQAILSYSILKFYFLNFKYFIYPFERERAQAGGRGEGEGEAGSLFPMLGLIPRP